MLVVCGIGMLSFGGNERKHIDCALMRTRMQKITKPISIKNQIIIWAVLLAFWILFSIRNHPTILIDVIVTSLLLIAYSTAIYLNHLIFIPRFFRSKNYVRYFSVLFLTMIVLTFPVHFAIRTVYFALWNPEQIGDYRSHYVVDLFGMMVHVVGAALLLWIISRMKRPNGVPFKV